MNEIKDLWDSHWLTNMGTKHRQLQAELEAFCDVPHVTLYTNGLIRALKYGCMPTLAPCQQYRTLGPACFFIISRY